MVKKTRKVVIDNKAKKQLRQAYNYIAKDSAQNAEKVKASLLASIKALIKIRRNIRRINTKSITMERSEHMNFTNTALHTISLLSKLQYCEYGIRK